MTDPRPAVVQRVVMKRRTIFARSAVGAAALLMTTHGCAPLKDLSSYSEGGVPEQSASLQPLPPDGMGNPVAPAPAPPTAIESNPTDAPLEPVPIGSESTASAPAAPTSGDAGLTPELPAVDAADECTVIGGFTIAGASSCYLVGETTLSWEEARSVCQAWGGDLVQIDSAEENAQLVQHFEGAAWIGATDLVDEGTFRWAGGDLLEYTAWITGQPNNLQGLEDCAELRTLDGGWVDVECTDVIERQALCERPPSS